MPRKFIASYQSRIVRDLVCDELLQSQAITFHLDKPKTLRGGIESPVYIDKYKPLSHPENWRDVLLPQLHHLAQCFLRRLLIAWEFRL